MSNPATQKQPYYQCQHCGACCKWQDDVKIETDEIKKIAQFLELPSDGFVEQFTRLRSNRKGLSLIEKDNHECIMLAHNNICMISEVKPRQCKGFPNTWNFQNWKNVCQAEAIQS